MQILGLGAIMLILPVAVWGWRMLTHRTFDREALRLGCWILCTVIAAGFASCWPHGGAWPLPTGLGGVVGDALVRAPAVVFGPAGFIYRLVLGDHSVRGDVRGLPVRQRLGLAPARDEELTPIEDDDAPFEEEGDRSSVSLGWVFSRPDEREGAARLADIGTAYRSLVASAPQPRTLSFERQEPNLGGRPAPSLAPQAHEITRTRKRKTTRKRKPPPPAPRARRPAPKASRANPPTSSNCLRSRC